MLTKKSFRTLFIYMITSMLVVINSGCGDGAGSGATPIPAPAPPATPPPTIENYIDLNAKTAAITAIRVGETATINGTSTTSSTEPLSYNWSFSFKPQGSNAELLNATTATPSFIADVRGVYILQMQISVEGISSQRTVTSVIATVAPERLTGRWNHPGLSSDCVNCHSGEIDFIPGVSIIPGKSSNHVATSNSCQSCHTPQGFSIIPFFDHQEIHGSCSECHNGSVAIGKSVFHTPTNAECDDCHNTSHFLQLAADGSFDHSSITRACSSCHNRTVAIGMTATTADIPAGTHPVTNSECGYCHTTVSFLKAYPDHTGAAVTGPGITCDSCHIADGSGSGAGQSIGHPVVNVDCATCHSIVSFSLGGVFNHSVVDPTIQSCESCHNDNIRINAPTKSSFPTHPVTTADCGSCHDTDAFTGAYVDHTGPEVVGKRCDTCHDGGAGGAIGKSVNHMTTTEDCSICHTPGTFTTGTYDHANVVTGCNACHDNVISVGKLANHIPTSPDDQNCSDCHNTTSFAGAVFVHTGIIDNCVSCHDGSISQGKLVYHIPTDQDCINCHSTTSAFKPAANFAHVGITDQCESCHDGSVNNTAAGAIGKTSNHIPSLNVCSACHSDTNSSGFKSSTFLTAVHQNINNGCEACHISRFIPANPNAIKALSHLPTAQDCDVCHTNDVFKPSIFNHAGITSNCASCHDGSNNNVNAGARGTTSTTIHQTTNEDCGVCHNTIDFTAAFVDHTGPEVVGKRCDSCHDGGAGGAIGKNPGHVITSEDCSLCHVPGSFTTAVFNHTGIVDNCVSCHDGSSAIATVKDAGHLPTSQDCSVCHITTVFSDTRFDHTGIINNCASCHDGAIARGKIPPPNHVPTTGDCSDCHQTTGFIPGTFDHTGIVDNCRTCHDGAFAIGKSSGHVATNQDCSICHTTSSFIGAGFDHTGIVDNCESCHDGTTAPGKDTNHISTAMDCHFCHTTASFVGGTWTHDASSTGRCDQCHSTTGGATPKSSRHLNTTEQCDVCHSTSRWAPDIFSHSSKGNYPGDHRRNPGCTGCHKSSIGAGINSGNYPNKLQYAPFCAGCHAGDFRSEGDHKGGKSGTVEQNKNCGASGCHRVTKSGF